MGECYAQTDPVVRHDAPHSHIRHRPPLWHSHVIGDDLQKLDSRVILEDMTIVLRHPRQLRMDVVQNPPCSTTLQHIYINSFVSADLSF